MRTRGSAALAALLTLLLPGSGLLGQSARGPDAPRTTDAPNPAPDPARVVSLHPAATEILLALGAADLLVGRMEGERTGPTRVLSQLPSIGEMLTPNLEVLALLQPDLVIAWEQSDLSALSRVVERRGGRVEPFALDRLGDVPSAMLQIGAWIGQTEAAERLAADFSATLAAARALAPPARPRVLWVVWSDPIVVAGPATFLHDVVEIAGARNAAAGVAAPWPRVGMETILAFDPDVLIWPEGPGLFPAAELRTRPGWRSVAAVEAGRVLVVDAERFHDAGPELAHAALDLARRLRSAGSP